MSSIMFLITGKSIAVEGEIAEPQLLVHFVSTDDSRKFSAVD